MKQLRYPGRFKREGRFIEVHLPGIGPFGTTTQGLDLDEARLMASDALTMKLQDIYGYRGTYYPGSHIVAVARSTSVAAGRVGFPEK